MVTLVSTLPSPPFSLLRQAMHVAKAGIYYVEKASRELAAIILLQAFYVLGLQACGTVPAQQPL